MMGGGGGGLTRLVSQAAANSSKPAPLPGSTGIGRYGALCPGEDAVVLDMRGGSQHQHHIYSGAPGLACKQNSAQF